MTELLRREFKKFATQTVFQIGNVVSIDKAKAVASVKLLENEEIVFEDVRLQAIDDEQDNGILFFPKLDSSVIIGKLDNVDSYFVAMASEIDEISWKLDGTERLKITADEIIFNEGNKGSLVEIQKLKTQLNALENAFNQLLNHYKTHNHAHPQGPTTALLPPNTQSNLTQTTISDLENNKIKQ